MQRPKCVKKKEENADKTLVFEAFLKQNDITKSYKFALYKNSYFKRIEVTK